MKHPWSKFYWADWRQDPRLRMCSLSARGLWIEMLALMHQAEPYGHLLVSGNAPTTEQLALLVGAPPSQVPDLLGELERAGVFSRTRKAVVYSRRMIRDEKKARTARENGKTGGNPSLGKRTGIPPSDNLPDKPQKPDTRSQRDPNGSQEAREGAFDAWYASYPHKVGRPAAKRAYLSALRRADPTALAEGLARYIATKPPDRPWCNPATWLNQERWNDQPQDIVNGAKPHDHGRTQAPHETLFAGFARAAGAGRG